MRCLVLQDFRLSRDGIRSEKLTEEQEVDIPKDLVRGLVKEGYVEPMGEPEPVELEGDENPEPDPKGTTGKSEDPKPPTKSTKAGK